MKSLSYYINNPKDLAIGIVHMLSEVLPESIYLKVLYRVRMGRKLNLKNPQTFCEKLQWLKLYDRKPEYTAMVDKYRVKEYVAKKIGAQYILPTLGVWDKPEDIDWDKLPNQFVLKTTHGGGGTGVVICKDKTSFNREKAIDKLNLALKQNLYKYNKEWPYKNVPKRIIAEKFIQDEILKDLPDYKFYCFNGEVKIGMIASNRFTTHNFNYFDIDYNPLPIVSADGENNKELNINKPKQWEEMWNIAQILSAPFYHIRVDLYLSDNKVYFGELTFFDSSGFDDLSSEYWNKTWGSWIKLPIQ